VLDVGLSRLASRLAAWAWGVLLDGLAGKPDGTGHSDEGKRVEDLECS